MAVLWIRILNFCLDPTPAKYEKQINKLCEFWIVCTVGLADTVLVDSSI